LDAAGYIQPAAAQDRPCDSLPTEDELDMEVSIFWLVGPGRWTQQVLNEELLRMERSGLLKKAKSIYVWGQDYDRSIPKKTKTKKSKRWDRIKKGMRAKGNHKKPIKWAKGKKLQQLFKWGWPKEKKQKTHARRLQNTLDRAGCVDLMLAHGISRGISWGNASPAQRRQWEISDCDTLALKKSQKDAQGGTVSSIPLDGTSTTSAPFYEEGKLRSLEAAAGMSGAEDPPPPDSTPAWLELFSAAPVVSARSVFIAL
jgi:hypothetical protein